MAGTVNIHNNHVRFNPRPRTGGDVKLSDVSCVDLILVSIRAPARGATPVLDGFSSKR